MMTLSSNLSRTIMLIFLNIETATRVNMTAEIMVVELQRRYTDDYTLP